MSPGYQRATDDARHARGVVVGKTKSGRFGRHHEDARDRLKHGVLARSRPEPMREPEEIYLVDRTQHHRDRALNNLVLDCCDREWALPAVRLRYIHPA
jgi:hypothetical protein